MHHVLAWQVFRQGAPRRFLRLDGCSDDGRSGCDPLGLIGFQRLDRQLELLGLTRQLLRRAAELGAPIAGQLEAQLRDLRLGGDRILHHRGDDPLQRIGVIGKLVG